SDTAVDAVLVAGSKVVFEIKDEYENPVQNANITVKQGELEFTVSTNSSGIAETYLAVGSYSYIIQKDIYRTISNDAAEVTGNEDDDKILETMYERVVGIEISTEPTKKVYYIGESFDPSGMKVEKVMASGRRIVITSADYKVEGFDSSKAAASQTITVKHVTADGTFEDTFTIEVREDKVVSISIISKPTKAVYYVGVDDTIDLTSGKIKAIWEKDNRAEELDMTAAGVSIEGFDSSKAEASQTITVSYGGKSATFTIEVREDKVIGIEWVTQFSKTQYKYGESLVLDGVKVKANYESGKPVQAVNVTSAMVSGYEPNKLGTQTITVTYEGYTLTCDVTVIDYQVGIEISTEPTRKVYYIGDAKLDLTGMKVEKVMASGVKVEILPANYTSEGVSI
ncbi:MAG TPA: bacterial Ig-like domain-containing protein, partial [Clostridia bacterium]|nr:bacterial Ig-like domain-containing protein [Clostridia bacterium]